jgi:hypothetical protein
MKERTISLASTRVPTIFNLTSLSFSILSPSSEEKQGGLLNGSNFKKGGIN